MIPVLLLDRGALWKTRGFSDPLYVGDAVNAVRVLNDKQVDEIALFDITATTEGRSPDYGLIKEIAGECFVPLCYGGGVHDLETMHRLYTIGVEKVSLNAAAFEQPDLVGRAAHAFGRQSVVVAIDVVRGPRGREVATRRGLRLTGADPMEHARRMADAGAGELFVTAVDREGSTAGYDLDLVTDVADAVSVPVVAHGGAGSIGDLALAANAGASAVAAGSMFVLYGRHRAVLITYPSDLELDAVLPAA